MFKIGSITISIENGEPEIKYCNILNQWNVQDGDCLFSNVEDAGKFLQELLNKSEKDGEDEN